MLSGLNLKHYSWSPFNGDVSVESFVIFSKFLKSNLQVIFLIKFPNQTEIIKPENVKAFRNLELGTIFPKTFLFRQECPD